MAIVSCPECGKKLKVGDASLGKKVKCSNGHIFVAQEEAPEAAAPPPKPAAAEKVMVACTECGAKLKVGVASLGKKMKCPKCTSVFVAKLDAPKPAPEPEVSMDDEDLAPPPPVKAKAKAKPARDEEDDLFTFAQAEAGDDDLPKPKPKPGKKPSADLDDDMPKFGDEDDDILSKALAEEEEFPKPKGKPKKPLDDDDDLLSKALEEEEELPKPKGKPKKPLDEDEDEEEMPMPKKAPARATPAGPPKYPSRLLVNLVVFFMLFAYVAVFAVIFLDVVTRRELEQYGLPKAKPVHLAKHKIKDIKIQKSDPGKAREANLAKRLDDEKKLLDEYRKKPKLDDFPGTVVTLQPGGAKVRALAFSLAASKLAVLTDDAAAGITVWDLAKLSETKIPLKTAGDSGCTLAFSVDGSMLAAACPDESTVRIFNAVEGKEIKSLDLGKAKPSSIAFGADSTSLIVIARAPGDEQDSVQGYGLQKWNLMPSIVALPKNSSAYVNAYGDRVIEIGEKGVVVHDLVAEKATPPKLNPRLTAFSPAEGALAPDGKSVVLNHKKDNAGYELLRINLEKADDVAVIWEGKEAALAPRLSADGQYVICTIAGADTLIDVASKKTKWARSTQATSTAFSPGGIFLAEGLSSPEGTASVHLLPIEDLKGITVTMPPMKEKDTEKDTKIIVDNNDLAKAEQAALAELKKLEKFEIPGVAGIVRSKGEKMQAMAFAPVNQVFATYDAAEGEIALWDLKTLKAVKSIPFKSEAAAAEFHLAFSPDASLLALFSTNAPILKVWDTKDGKETPPLSLGEKEIPSALSFKSDGKEMYVVLGSEVRSWSIPDWTAGKVTSAFVEPSIPLLSANGDRLIEIEKEGDGVAIHDLRSLKGKVFKIQREPELKPDSFTQRAISPDGKFIAWTDGKEKPRLMLLDVDGVKATMLTEANAKNIVFSPNGKYLFYEGGDINQLFDIAAKKVIWSQPNALGATYAFSPGGVFFAIKNTANVHLFSIEDALKQGPEAPKTKTKPAENK